MPEPPRPPVSGLGGAPQPPGPGLGRRFWTVWSATTLSNLGDGVVLAAVPLLAAELTREPVWVAATTVAIRLPWLVFGLFAGVVVDRTDRLRVMLAADLARMALFAVLATAIALDRISLAWLYLALFAAGVLETLFDTAAMSITPDLVEHRELERANARIDGAQIAANEFVGPPLGGAMFAMAAAIPFGVDAASFAASAVLLLTVRGRYRPRRARRTTVRSDIRVGLRFIWREPVIRAFAIGAGVVNLAFAATGAILVLHAQDNLGLDTVGFGLLLSAAAAGALVGAQLAPRVIESVGRRRVLLSSVAAMAVGILATGAARTSWQAAAGLALFGLASEFWDVISVSYRQAASPHELRGRVMSGFRVIAYGAFPVGAAAGGLLASTAGLRSVFFVGATVVACLLPYLAAAWRRPSAAALDRSPGAAESS